MTISGKKTPQGNLIFCHTFVEMKKHGGVELGIGALDKVHHLCTPRKKEVEELKYRSHTVGEWR